MAFLWLNLDMMIIVDYYLWEGLSPPARAGNTLGPAYAQTCDLAGRHNSEMVEIPAGAFLMGDRKERVHFPQDWMGQLGPLVITAHQWSSLVPLIRAFSALF